MANELSKQFLDDIEVKDDVIAEQPPEPEKEEAEAKNRRERRLMAKLQAEREANIDLNARLQTIAEAKSRTSESMESDFRRLIEPIYGNDTPEKKAATDLLEKALLAVKDSAKQEALKEALDKIKEDREEEYEAVAKEEDTLDDMMDDLSDSYGANFDDEATRIGFLNLLEKVSPKDRDGNIVEYADADTTWELFQSQRSRTSNRARELASRGMTNSGSSQPSKLQEDATWRLLKESGIF